MKNKKRALFSLYTEDKVVFYARELFNLGWEIVATKETSKLLAKNGIKATDVSRFLGIKDNYPFPPTLHPAIELALTTNKGKTIDLVYDTTYPVSSGTDVGGHTLLALGAKGKRIVVNNKEDMAEVIEQLKNNNNELDASFRQRLIDKAYIDIAKFYSTLVQGFDIDAVKITPLLNGENPYQIPADHFYTDSLDPLALDNFKQISGELPCYTNMADFDSILKIICSLSAAFYKHYKKVPFVTIAAKHGNPCGLAIDWKSQASAIDGALWANPTAIWGGEVITNFAISKKLLGSPKWMLDLIVAPDFSKQAIKVLAKNPRRKIFKNDALMRPQLSKSIWSYRMVRGGFLRQPPNNYVLDFSDCNTDFSLPKNHQLDSLIIAWATAWFSNHGGNEVAIAKDRRLIGAGGGPSTVDACITAILRAKRCSHNLKNSVFAANAFFPFTDGPRKLIKAGCVYGVVPSGGKNINLVKGLFEKYKVGVFYLREELRGFSRH